jgi:hypothetical protein
VFHDADIRRADVVSDGRLGYTAYLQTDDCAGYNAVTAGNQIT